MARNAAELPTLYFLLHASHFNAILNKARCLLRSVYNQPGMQLGRSTYAVREWQYDRGRFRFWIPEPNLLFVAIYGYFHRELVPPYMTALNAWLQAAPRPVIFCDWTRMERYDRASREALTRWVMTNRTNVHQLELLVSSPFIAMGVSLANAVLGNFMSVTTKEADFWARLRTVSVQLAVADALDAVRADDAKALQVERHTVQAEDDLQRKR
jgi:hypothetical protein